MFDQWTIAVFQTMGGYCPAIFRGYWVKYVGVWDKEIPKASNDNGEQLWTIKLQQLMYSQQWLE